MLPGLITAGECAPFMEFMEFMERRVKTSECHSAGAKKGEDLKNTLSR